MSNTSEIGRDPRLVSDQYAQPFRLLTRASVRGDDPVQGSPKDAALAAVTAASPGRVLEIGCGTAEFAARVAAALPGAEVVATDQSVGMVAEAHTRGVAAHQVEATALPYPDDSFDVVAALWMLYHVPDLARTITEIVRVLRPGGRLVAATNGREHTADLRALAGLPPADTQFTTETAVSTLAPCFAEVHIQRFSPVAVLDHAGAQAYIASFAPEAAATIEPYDGERTFHGAGCVITCRT